MKDVRLRECQQRERLSITAKDASGSWRDKRTSAVVSVSAIGSKSKRIVKRFFLEASALVASHADVLRVGHAFLPHERLLT